MRPSALLCLIALVANGGCSGDTTSDGASKTDASSGSAGAAGSGGASGSGGSGAAAGSGGASGTGATSGADAGPACADGGAADASVEDVLRQSCVVAVVRVSRLDEECSGLGGRHVTFAVVEMGRGSAVTAPTHGGHGYFPSTDGPDQVGDVFVAGIDPYGTLVARPDNSAWCLTGLPPVDGYAHTLLSAADEGDARVKMQTILSR